MDYESFKEKFVEDVKDRLYEQGAEVDLSIHTVNKQGCHGDGSIDNILIFKYLY